jgi:general secretion pathway protein G
MSFDRKKSFAQRGFSLVELMVVIVIIGLLSGVATISVRSYLVRGKQTVARMEVAKLAQAIDTFYGHFDRYPTNEEGINVLVEKSDAFPDGLLNKVPVDPWGHAYEYNYPGRNGPYELVSYGADHQEGGTGADADISSADVEVARDERGVLLR